MSLSYVFTASWYCGYWVFHSLPPNTSEKGSPACAPLMLNTWFPGNARISSLILSRFSSGADTSLIPFWLLFVILTRIAFAPPVVVLSLSRVIVAVLVVVASSAPVNSLFPLVVCSSVMIQFSQNFAQSVIMPFPWMDVVTEIRALVFSPFPTSCVRVYIVTGKQIGRAHV